MASAPHLLTYEEWLQMPTVEDGTDEVVNGVLRFMPPTHYPHAEVIQRLIEAFLPLVDRKRVGLLGSNLGLMISREPLTCRSPDLILFWRDQMEVRDGLYYSPPGLVVEILSPSENRRRKQEKMDDYASIGVPEVWVCAPGERSIEICRLANGRMNSESTLSGGLLGPSRFPGVSINIAEIWPD
ncbi:MAG: Uma2 family endonuclease [Bryobacteraceae bacterium]